LAGNIIKNLQVNDYHFAHLNLMLSLHYLVEFSSRSLAVCNNEFILGSACVGNQKITETTKSL